MNPAVPARVHADVLRTRGILLRRVGRVREAVDALRRGHRRVPSYGGARAGGARQNALAYAMFVQGRYEDAIALALEAIRIDLSIGGRFQLAKTLTNISTPTPALVTRRAPGLPPPSARRPRAVRRSRRQGRYAARRRAEVVLEFGDADAAEAFVREAAPIAHAARQRLRHRPCVRRRGGHRALSA